TTAKGGFVVAPAGWAGQCLNPLCHDHDDCYGKECIPGVCFFGVISESCDFVLLDSANSQCAPHWSDCGVGCQSIIGIIDGLVAEELVTPSPRQEACAIYELSCSGGCVNQCCCGCGNGSIDPGEQCDGSNLNGETCQSRGFACGGTLTCSSCSFDTSG